MVDAVSVGILLIFAGAAVIAVAVLRSQGPKEGQVRGGAVLFVGPIPIAFGSDAKWVSVALVLAVILLVAALLSYRGWP